MIPGPPSAQTIRKIAIVGPECTGKTDLAQFLAGHYQTEWVPEYARAFLNKLRRPYEASDLVKIAHGQLRMEDEWTSGANRVLICDTNLIVIKVWMEHRYGSCDPEVLRALAARHYDLLLLTNIDIPWEEDVQREHPDKRAFFWEWYQREAAASGIPVVVISGDRETRRRTAINAIDPLLQ